MVWIRGARVLFAGVVLAAACSGKAPQRKSAAEPANASEKLPPGFKLDLPTAPIVPKKSLVPAQYPDGAYSVQGALAKRDPLNGRDVSVSGFVVKVHVPTEEECEAGCTPAHLYLADSADVTEGKQLLVADFEAAQAEALTKGAKVTVVGQLVKQSTSGFSRTEGLLSFKSLQSK